MSVGGLGTGDVEVDVDLDLQVVSLHDLALSGDPDYKAFVVGGSNSNIGNSSYDLLGPSMGSVGDTLILPNVAASLTVVSTSVSDTGQIYVEYIDADWYERSAVVTMTGTTPIVVIAAALRVNRAIYINGSNVGTISFAVGGVTLAKIAIGYGNARVAMYTAPRGQRSWILQVTADVETTKTANMRLRSKPRNATGNLTQVESFSVSTFTPTTLPIPRRIIGLDGGYGVTVWIDAKLVTTGSGIVSGHMQILAKKVEDTLAPGFGLF